jgi:hypothetical protein
MDCMESEHIVINVLVFEDNKYSFFNKKSIEFDPERRKLRNSGQTFPFQEFEGSGLLAFPKTSIPGDIKKCNGIKK